MISRLAFMAFKILNTRLLQSSSEQIFNQCFFVSRQLNTLPLSFVVVESLNSMMVKRVKESSAARTLGCQRKCRDWNWGEKIIWEVFLSPLLQAFQRFRGSGERRAVLSTFTLDTSCDLSAVLFQASAVSEAKGR